MKNNILNIYIDNFSKSEVLARMREFLRASGQHKIFTPNPEMLVLASRDSEFKNILNSADILVPDGFGLILAARFLGMPFCERITGVDLVYEITKIAAEENKSIFLLGGGEGVSGIAATKLSSELNVKLSMFQWLDGLKINNKNAQGIIEKVNSITPDVLFVAFGHGKQERFINDNLHKMPSVKLALGIGGALDFISGETRRAPKILQKIGLEWLWRLILEPRRILRIFDAVIIFPIKVLFEKNKSTSK